MQHLGSWVSISWLGADRNSYLNSLAFKSDPWSWLKENLRQILDLPGIFTWKDSHWEHPFSLWSSLHSLSLHLWVYIYSGATVAVKILLCCSGNHSQMQGSSSAKLEYLEKTIPVFTFPCFQPLILCILWLLAVSLCAVLSPCKGWLQQLAIHALLWPLPDQLSLNQFNIPQCLNSPGYIPS